MAHDVKDIDRGYNAFVRSMRKHYKGPYVTVGIQGTEATAPRKDIEDDPDRVFGDTNIELAAVHEFGSRDGRVPQRSFIRATVDRERTPIQNLLDDAVRNIARHGDARRHMGRVGEKVQAFMVRTIDRSIGLKPLADRTIEQKGSSRPLINTGQLKNAISWRVHRA